MNLKNWRPLTSLNTDNKIYSKMIANRMQEVMSNLINSDQTGFMKGRQMAENIMRIMQVIQYCQTHAQNAFLVSFDFEKAFDTIEWLALFEIMKKLNFGERFIGMTKVIFTNPLICASNNGYWSDFFIPTWGCRQGCCFSPSGFTLVAEALSSALRQNPNIKGIKIGLK